MAALWATHSEHIMAEHVTIYPGTRPARWWQHDSTRYDSDWAASARPRLTYSPISPYFDTACPQFGLVIGK